MLEKMKMHLWDDTKGYLQIPFTRNMHMLKTFKWTTHQSLWR